MEKIRKKKKKKISFLKLVLLIFVGILVVTILTMVIGGYITQRYVYTPQFKGTDGKVLPDSIAEYSRVKLGDYVQGVLIRGRNKNNPVLLFLHGGPGSSELSPSRNLNAIVEDYYTVVYWEQRGAGKSFSVFADPKKMNLEQFVSDAHELTAYIKQKLNKEKIVLIGHSWGSGLGAILAQRYPEDYLAYIGMGQIVNLVDNERLSYEFTIGEARKQGNIKAVKELETIDGYWKNPSDLRSLMIERKWLTFFGGAMHGYKDYSLIAKNIYSEEYTIFDLPNFFFGSFFSIATMWSKIVPMIDLTKRANSFKIPFYIFQGRYDYNVPASLTEMYFNLVKAPYKRFVWFEKSAHMPNFEEPEKYNRTLIDIKLHDLADK